MKSRIISNDVLRGYQRRASYICILYRIYVKVVPLYSTKLALHQGRNFRQKISLVALHLQGTLSADYGVPETLMSRRTGNSH